MATPHRSRTELADTLAEKMERLRFLEHENKRLSKETLDAKIIRKEIFKLSAKKPDLPGWMLGVNPTYKTSGPGIPLLFGSDWHWGERVNPAEIGGVNQFDMQTAHRRARVFFTSAVEMLKKHMVNPKYPGIILILGGDLLSGDIHAELSKTNAKPTIPALLDLFGVLVEGIDFLQKEFGTVIIPCVTGNHGRTTDKIQSKERHYTSYDWLLYQMLEQHYTLRGDAPSKNVKFLISDSVDQLFQVYNHKFLLTHGDTLAKGGDGIIGCVGPMIRGDQKTRSRNGQIGQSYDTLLCGHFHQQLSIGTRVLSNGSLIGYNEFAANTLRAPFEEPKQLLFCVHPERGITYQMPIFLEPKKVHEEKTWISWQE